MKQSERVPELDGLRGIAIGLVLLHHTLSPVPALKPFFDMCWSGVDLFFVLSGFLLGGVLLDHKDAPNLLRVFYTRRVCRILPLYFGLIAIYWLALQAPMPGFPPWAILFLGQPFVPVWSCLTFTQNFYVATAGGLGATIISSTWSLAVEEQFYLILPFFMRTLSGRWLPGLLVAGTLAAPLFRWACLHWNYPIATYVLLPCRADALLLGVLSAWLLRSPEWLKRFPFAAGWRAMLVLLAGTLALNGLWPDMLDFPMALWGHSWLALFYAGLVLLVVRDPGSRMAGVCRWSGLRTLGRLSYFLYLAHQPMLHVGHAIFFGESLSTSNIPVEALVVAFFTLCLTAVLADVSWRLFEKPIIDIGHRSKYVSSN